MASRCCGVTRALIATTFAVAPFFAAFHSCASAYVHASDAAFAAA